MAGRSYGPKSFSAKVNGKRQYFRPVPERNLGIRHVVDHASPNSIEWTQVHTICGERLPARVTVRSTWASRHYYQIHLVDKVTGQTFNIVCTRHNYPTDTLLAQLKLLADL